MISNNYCTLTKCGFLLAGSLSTSVLEREGGGFQVTWLIYDSVFVVPCAIA